MNKVFLMGNLTRDPLMKKSYKQDGSEIVITKYDLAVGKGMQEGEADFFRCTSFGKQAEFVAKYFHKGTRICLVGRIVNNNYTNKSGEKVYGFNIIGEEVEFAQKKSDDKGRNDGFEIAEPENSSFR